MELCQTKFGLSIKPKKYFSFILSNDFSSIGSVFVFGALICRFLIKLLYKSIFIVLFFSLKTLRIKPCISPICISLLIILHFLLKLNCREFLLYLTLAL